MKYAIALIFAAFPVLAAQQTWTGQISDNMCGANHAAMGDMGKNPKECTAGCVKGGSKYVFVANGKVFEIANQSYGELSKAAGQNVSLTGDLASDGKTITVSKLQAKK
jgi:hypothetical protein